MFHYFQKLYLSIKYRKVLKAYKQENDPSYENDLKQDASDEVDQPVANLISTDSNPETTGKERFYVWLIVAMFFALTLSMTLGFGYIHTRNGRRLESQKAVDQHGVEVDATIESLELEIIKHSNSRTGETESSSSESRFCNIAVRYTVPESNEPLRKSFRLEDDTLCKRYKVGEIIKAKYLPDQPGVIVLDEGRLPNFWYWVSLVLCLFFAGLTLLSLRLVYSLLRAKW